MALRVGIVGLPNSGKTTLFNALTRAGAQVTAYEDVAQKPNVGMAVIADDRLDRLAQTIGSRKTTPAAIRIVDVPGRAEIPGELRQVDALLAVLDGFSEGAAPDADIETLRLELIVADREHVARRLERVRKEAKSGDRAKRQEVEVTERLLAHLDDGQPLSAWTGELPAELEPLTTLPLIPLENGPGGIDCALEMELAELPDEEAAEFRSGASALDDVVLRLKEALGLITFFTVGDTEARSWTLRHGQTALDAAESIHTDIARGFIRCEVIRWDDLLECGTHAEAARRGLQRLEGKAYVVEDGDVLNVRFNVEVSGRRSMRLAASAANQRAASTTTIAASGRANSFPASNPTRLPKTDGAKSSPPVVRISIHATKAPSSEAPTAPK
jgi:ribosome-binding ATPase YchF (GTP1/OBG family)